MVFSQFTHVLRYVKTFAFLLLLLFSSVQAWAQPELTSRFRAGREAFEAARYDEAVQQFSAIVKENPGFRLDIQGAAVFWLGKAHSARSEHSQALDVWRGGIRALESEEAFDVLLADAYTRSVFKERVQSEYVRAIDAYLGMLDVVGSKLRPHEKNVVDLHVRQMIFLLPDELRRRVVDTLGEPRDKMVYDSGAGALLVNWWHSQDPLPASVWNERVAEHLERVTEAGASYASLESPSGFDDRGKLYVRLGAPSQVERIRSYFLNSRKALMADAEFAGVSFLPRNEFWTYSHLGRAARYLFAWERGAFRHAGLEGMMPNVLRRGFSSSDRGRFRASLSIQLMREFLYELAWLDPGYTATYLRVDDAVEGRGPPIPIFIVVSMLMQETKVAERQLETKRRAEVPRSSSGFSTAPSLPVELRLARFLDADGTTRTEVYWAVPAGELVPPPGVHLEILRKHPRLSYEHMILLSAVQQQMDFQPRKITRRKYSLSDNYSDDADSPVYTTIVRGDTGLYHLALQWDQYMVHETGNVEDPEDHSFIRRGVQRVDSLAALDPSSGTLVMSDLVPLVAGSIEETDLVRDEQGFRAPVYVRKAITPQTNLALYFEVYNLVFGDDDQTHYTVSYKVSVDEKREGIAGLLGRRELVTTAVSTSHTGYSLTTREYVMLDLAEWDTADRMLITVRLLDEVTGKAADRSIEFVLMN